MRNSSASGEFGLKAWSDGRSFQLWKIRWNATVARGLALRLSTVILSEVADARSAAAAQSKDPTLFASADIYTAFSR
jgi:hypothetical protein